MPVSNVNGCECGYTGKEPSPTGLGYCPQCHPKGTKGIGTDKNIWVIKTDGKGTNYWVKVSTTSIRKDGGVWRCTDCIKVETPLPAVTKTTTVNVQKTKVVCVGGRCKVQPSEARFYEFDTDATQAISIHSATYGDILARKNTYKCEESYIVNKQGVLQQLDIDSSSQCVIPDNFLNDLGIFYWDNISVEAELGYPYNRKNFEELRQQLHKGQVHMEGLLKEYGTTIVTALSVKKTVQKPIKKPSRKTVKKKPSRKPSRKSSRKAAKKRSSRKGKRGSNLDKRSVVQLRALAKKRGRKVPSGATKDQLLQILRGKKVTVKKQRGCYEAMTRAELLKRASKRNISGRSSMTKEKLIYALRGKVKLV
jgi:hypothetical protein